MAAESAGEAMRGESASLDDVYTAEIQRLVALGTVLTGDGAAGEDLAHDAFLQLVQRVRRQPDYLSGPAWPLLRTMVVRLALQRRRAWARELRRLARVWQPPRARSGSRASQPSTGTLRCGRSRRGCAPPSCSSTARTSALLRRLQHSIAHRAPLRSSSARPAGASPRRCGGTTWGTTRNDADDIRRSRSCGDSGTAFRRDTRPVECVARTQDIGSLEDLRGVRRHASRDRRRRRRCVIRTASEYRKAGTGKRLWPMDGAAAPTDRKQPRLHLLP